CFLLLTSSLSQYCQVRLSSSLAHTSSSEKISPIKFPALNSTIELSPPHNCLYEPPDVVPDDEKEHEKKKGKFKRKEK
ncbi:RBP1 protein, partial [Quiscalus mexicanus]|nr:RBP1 protein [Quiscalus mexicanus]